MRYIFLILLFLCPSVVWAENTHSISLDGSTQSLTEADTAGLSITGDISVEAWVYIDQLPSTATHAFHILQKGDDVRANYRFFIDTDDLLYFSFDDGANTTTFHMDDAFDAGDVGAWVHVAAKADVSVPTIAFYKNGSPSAGTSDATAATSIQDAASCFAIGVFSNCSGGGIRYFDGLIDEVRVWNDLRSDAEILNNYNVETSDTGNLVAYWQLDNDLLDASGNSHTLTNVGSATFSSLVPFGTVAAGFTLFLLALF